jgi:type I restriction enzyme S subunit
VITGATVDRIPLEKFPEFPAVLPKLSIQKEITSILSAYDELIENNRRRLALLEEAPRLLFLFGIAPGGVRAGVGAGAV